MYQHSPVSLAVKVFQTAFPHTFAFPHLASYTSRPIHIETLGGGKKTLPRICSFSHNHLSKTRLRFVNICISRGLICLCLQSQVRVAAAARGKLRVKVEILICFPVLRCVKSVARSARVVASELINVRVSLLCLVMPRSPPSLWGENCNKRCDCKLVLSRCISSKQFDMKGMRYIHMDVRH